jgi:hypothetical protein
MTDAPTSAETPPEESAPESSAPETATPRSRTGLYLGLGVGGFLVFVAIVTVVLMTSLSVIGATGLPSGAARRALLTATDVSKIDGVRIDTGRESAVRSSTLQAYVRANPGDSSHTVSPAKCADNLEGWMAWKSLDTPTYRGWKTDTIYAASNIVVDGTGDYQNGLQESRHFATVAAATAFMTAERGWYRDCATTTYSDPQDPSDDSSFRFSPISLNLGLDSVVEGSTNTGENVAPHLIDIYLRNANIVYVSELVTSTAPQHGMDKVSLAIVTAAADKLRSLR